MEPQTGLTKMETLKLVIALFIDFMGIISYFLPGMGELFDAFWAPLSAILVFIFFKRKWIWASFTFLEEVLPFSDVIPSATLAWYMEYARKKHHVKKL